MARIIATGNTFTHKVALRQWVFMTWDQSSKYWYTDKYETLEAFKTANAHNISRLSKLGVDFKESIAAPPAHPEGKPVPEVAAPPSGRSWVCSECERENRGNRTACWGCGSRL